MDSGVIGSVDGHFDQLDSFTRTREDRGQTVRRAMDIQRPIQGPNDTLAYSGRAAIERVEEQPTFQFQDGEIIQTEELSKTTYYTEFIVVPDSFMVVDSSAGKFAFQLLDEEADTMTERAEIDLFRTLDQLDVENVWQAGFYGHQGPAENGVVFGDDVLEDGDLGGMIENSSLNQLGVIFDRNGIQHNVRFTESGYVDVYNPSNTESEDFVEIISDIFYPNLRTQDSP
ncbi:hypothetical protein ACKVMT_09940 [Halobacteriales archaeon Cl-PHB]